MDGRDSSLEGRPLGVGGGRLLVLVRQFEVIQKFSGVAKMCLLESRSEML